MDTSHTHRASHDLCVKLWSHPPIKATLELAKVHTNPVTLHPWEFDAYITQFSPHSIHSTYFWKSTSLFPQKLMAM